MIADALTKLTSADVIAVLHAAMGGVIPSTAKPGANCFAVRIPSPSTSTSPSSSIPSPSPTTSPSPLFSPTAAPDGADGGRDPRSSGDRAENLILPAAASTSSIGRHGRYTYLGDEVKTYAHRKSTPGLFHDEAAETDTVAEIGELMHSVDNHPLAHMLTTQWPARTPE